MTTKEKDTSLFSPKSKKQAMMIQAARDHQITVIGGAAGSGKSYILQLLPLLFADDPNFEAVMFRRTNPQLVGQGGLWDTAMSIYSSLPPEKRPKVRHRDLEFIFPNPEDLDDKGIPRRTGARVKYRSMQHEKDKYDSQGLQYSLIGFDEGTQFSWGQISYLQSRMRSASKSFSRMVISCNPDNDHELKTWISWYLDEDGYPIPEREGKTRYYIMQGGEPVWANTKQELLDLYGENKRPISFCFVSATIRDNPVLMKNEPDYLAQLEGLPEIDRAQLLDGCWNVRTSGVSYFDRENLIKLDRVPPDAHWARGWDLAYQDVNTLNKDPDFSASCKMGKTRDGRYVIVGQHHPSNKDKHIEQYGRFREKSGERDRRIALQGNYDGKECIVVLPKDPAAGEIAFQETSKRLIQEGLRVKKDPVPSNKDKLSRFIPFSDAVEAGLVYIVESTFDKASLEAFYKELERFIGERSGRAVTKKDD